MIKISFNKKINGDLLSQEFANAGFTTDVVVYPGDLLELNGLEESDTEIANQILNAHVAPEIPNITPVQKLEAAGLTVEELKDLLGLN